MKDLHNANGTFKKGNPGFWLGKKRTDMTGKQNPRWSGGKIKKICLQCKKTYSIGRYRKFSKFCSHACKAKYYFSGEKNPNWKGGISKGKDKFKSSFYYLNWRNKVFKRDKWTCKSCGLRSKKSKAHGDKRSDIEAHHIIPLRDNIKLSLKVGNGITLCESCHKLTYGKEENFVLVFKEILNDYMPNISKE